MPTQIFVQTLTCGVTGSTLVSGINLPAGSRNVTVFIPSQASGTDIRFYVSYNDSTYKNLYYAPVSGTVAVSKVTIGSAISNSAVKVNELQGQLFIKTEIASAITTSDSVFVYQVEY